MVEEGPSGESTGGRPSRTLHFRARAGSLLVAELGATSINAAITDLAGGIIEQVDADMDIADGPDVVLAEVERHFGAFAKRHRKPGIWGIGLGVPGPVEFSLGTPTSPPIMPGWDRYPVRQRLSSRFRAPTWVDNDVNVLALGELRRGLAMGVDDAIFVKVGTGIGAGLISDGHLHRGAQGAAGDIGHVSVGEHANDVCRCGKLGCLEAVAGGQAIGRRGMAAARDGSSPFLARILAEHGTVTARDVAAATTRGDLLAHDVLNGAGQQIGRMIAALVNFYNPSLVVIGGGVANAGDQFLASIRQAIYERSLPLATRDLRIVRSELGDLAGVYGAAALVSDQLLSSDLLPQWIDRASPIDMPSLPGVPAPAA